MQGAAGTCAVAVAICGTAVLRTEAEAGGHSTISSRNPNAKRTQSKELVSEMRAADIDMVFSSDDDSGDDDDDSSDDDTSTDDAYEDESQEDGGDASSKLYYRAVQKALVRAGFESDAAKVSVLAPGTVVEGAAGCLMVLTAAYIVSLVCSSRNPSSDIFKRGDTFRRQPTQVRPQRLVGGAVRLHVRVGVRGKQDWRDNHGAQVQKTQGKTQDKQASGRARWCCRRGVYRAVRC